MPITIEHVKNSDILEVYNNSPWLIFDDTFWVSN